MLEGMVSGNTQVFPNPSPTHSLISFPYSPAVKGSLLYAQRAQAAASMPSAPPTSPGSKPYMGIALGLQVKQHLR